MDRKDFIAKFSGVLMLTAFTALGIAQEPPAKDKKYTVISKRCDGCGHCFRACRDKALLGFRVSGISYSVSAMTGSYGQKQSAGKRRL